MNSYFAEHAWLAHGWAPATRIDVDSGKFSTIAEDAERADAELLGRFVLPGMPNLHSHAFQRAMAGLAERQTHSDDSFWTWRETMYAFAGRIGPNELRAIATQLYVEMLKAGYTQVCEFHYLHQRPDGSPYSDPAEMSLALIEAARDAGIGLTLLPTLYITGGFDGRALSERQRRFGHRVDGYLRLLESLRAYESAMLRVGCALHSLRAVPEDAMHTVLSSGLVDEAPIHIHIAEQIGEVQDCLALRGARPVEWLLDHVPVDARWCLVHATHMTAQETTRVAASGAVVGLCPTTEANLGDGIFPLRAYLDAGGAFGIGSDSNISVSPVEELRWLEYGQRLSTRHRNIAVSDSSNSVGENLWGDSLFGGAQASGANIAVIEQADHASPEYTSRADLLVLDAASAQFAARDSGTVLDSLLFAGNSAAVRDVMVNGAWQVRDFHHRDEVRIQAAYVAAVEGLLK